MDKKRKRQMSSYYLVPLCRQPRNIVQYFYFYFMTTHLYPPLDSCASGSNFRPNDSTMTKFSYRALQCSPLVYLCRLQKLLEIVTRPPPAPSPSPSWIGQNLSSTNVQERHVTCYNTTPMTVPGWRADPSPGPENIRRKKCNSRNLLCLIIFSLEKKPERISLTSS